jgi:hypothetical protein
MFVIAADRATEIYAEVPFASTREALRRLGEWLDDDGASGVSNRELPHP